MEKINQVIDLVEHPERYSEVQIAEILRDEECRETYLAMLETRMAFDKEASENRLDMDKEWEMFVAKHPEAVEKNLEDKASHFAWSKIAASIVGVCLLSGIAFAAIHTIRVSHQEGKVVAADTTKSKTVVGKDTISVLSVNAEKQMREKQVIHKTFDNVTLETMLGEMAKYYGVELSFRNQEAKQLRFYYEWNSESNLQEVLEELNHSEQMNLSLEDGKLLVE